MFSVCSQFLMWDFSFFENSRFHIKYREQTNKWINSQECVLSCSATKKIDITKDICMSLAFFQCFSLSVGFLYGRFGYSRFLYGRFWSIIKLNPRLVTWQTYTIHIGHRQWEKITLKILLIAKKDTPVENTKNEHKIKTAAPKETKKGKIT